MDATRVSAHLIRHEKPALGVSFHRSAQLMHARSRNENLRSSLVSDASFGGIEQFGAMTHVESALASAVRADEHHEHSRPGTEWLIDNAEVYGPLLESLHGARRSIHIAQLAFDADCAAYSRDSPTGVPSRDAVIAETLVDLATGHAPEIRILLNATWILNTARPLRKYFAACGVSAKRIQVRGMSRFPHFMHAKLVLIDGREAFLLGSPFVNSYWDDGSHIPFEPRRPLRELGGRPLHDVSLRLRGRVVSELEAMFEKLWKSSERGKRSAMARTAAPVASVASVVLSASVTGSRLVCDAPPGVLPGVPDRAMHMLTEILAGIARARRFIYIEHQYLTSRPIAAALATALQLVPQLEIIIVLNQNPDLTAYRGWQNAQLSERGLLAHPRVGVFALWSTDAHPNRPGITRISQLFIHSKVLIVDDEWAAAGTSNLDGVSMGDYGDDFASALGRRVFRGVRNVEVNVIIDAQDAHDVSHGRNAPLVREEESHTIIALRERLWHEHLGPSMRKRVEGGWLALWREAAARNVHALAARIASSNDGERRVDGNVLPYSTCANPRDQLAELGIHPRTASLELCYNPTWLSVHVSPHWIRNIF
jgi:phosphatidylserine/phosphatidylglycerophosphate/cardiolipin synthase-like enzyme